MMDFTKTQAFTLRATNKIEVYTWDVTLFPYFGHLDQEVI